MAIGPVEIVVESKAEGAAVLEEQRQKGMQIIRLDGRDDGTFTLTFMHKSEITETTGKPLN